VSFVRPVGGAGAVAERRTTIDAAPGFGATLDALLPKPSASVPSPAGIQFSKHASARMASRGIELDEADLADLSSALDTLARRGAKESLVLMDDHAFIVGVPDRRVVTAMTRGEAVGNVFTQIDSTVVVR
jgi:flagellar operon protein